MPASSASRGDLQAAEQRWREQLPKIISDYSSRWSLRLGPPFAGGSASWVAPGRTAAGDPVVLKLGWSHDEALHEADGLRIWAGNGTVRLLESLVTGQTSALLLEACRPGTQLSKLRTEPEQDVIVASLLRRLWLEPPPGHPFRPLAQMCEMWADRFEEQSAAARARGQLQLDPGIAGAGIALLRELPATASQSLLLATDLHHDNVLAAEREPWLVIDPKPYVGDPAYDTLQHMLNFPGRLASDPAGFAARMADLLDLDRERVRLWLFARCVQESVDEPPLQNAARRLAP